MNSLNQLKFLMKKKEKKFYW